MINARSETVRGNAAFRDSFRQRRCLIPADGFYEWKKSGKTKRPFHFGMKRRVAIRVCWNLGLLEIARGQVAGIVLDP